LTDAGEFLLTGQSTLTELVDQRTRQLMADQEKNPCCCFVKQLTLGDISR